MSRRDVARCALVLVGPPGAGKTTAGRLLADRLGLEFRDVDADVEAAAGKPVSEIFVDDGEERFRRMERDAVAAALSEHDGVLALGGGAVLDSQTRKLLDQAPVAFLSAELTAAVSRVGLGAGRPLLTVNPRATLKALLEQRRPLYEEVADVTVATDGLTAEEVADRLAVFLGAVRRVRVGGSRPYPVLIGAGATAQLGDFLGGARQVAVVHAAPLRDRAEQVCRFLEAQGVESLRLEAPDGEAGKTVAAAEDCWERLGRAGLSREDVVVGLGGGAVTDLAGFVAACWLRGVDVVQVPTSLLGMVDAAVGGKTGVNTAAGKNLVGAFHPPRAVLCDVEALESLPGAELTAGLAEVVKCGFIADEAIVELLESDPGAAVAVGSAASTELIERAVAVKAEVVSQDLRESGRRAVLNFGHTFGHAVEKVEGYRRRHGEAVAIGMMYAAALGAAVGRADVRERLRAVLEGLGLPTSYPAGRWPQLREAMGADKKVSQGSLRFVLLDRMCEPQLVSGVGEDVLRRAYEEISR